ncbi:F-box protein CPR1-like [Fagus crenata]
MVLFQLLPVEFVMDIISRLPEKSLVRFKSVSKSWRSLASKALHLLWHSSDRDSNYLTIIPKKFSGERTVCKVIHNNVESFETNEIEIPLRRPSERYSVLCSHNGILCMSDGCRFFYLWNPSKSIFRSIPYPPYPLGDRTKMTTTHGIGSDPLNRAFLIIRIIYFSGCSGSSPSSSPSPCPSTCDMVPMDLNMTPPAPLETSTSSSPNESSDPTPVMEPPSLSPLLVTSDPPPPVALPLTTPPAAAPSTTASSSSSIVTRSQTGNLRPHQFQDYQLYFASKHPLNIDAGTLLTPAKKLPHAEVYSLNTNSWSRIESVVPCLAYDEPTTFFNGAIHWRAFNHVIMYFKTAELVFGEIKLPVKCFDHIFWYLWKPAVLLESLAFIVIGSVHAHPARNKICDIWIMDKYGVVETWTKLFTIPLRDAFVARPLGVTEDDELLQDLDGELICYDLYSRQNQSLGFQGAFKTFHVDTFTESLSFKAVENP